MFETPTGSASLLERRVLPALVCLAGCLAAWCVPSRGIDPDELEHLHAAFCVSQGSVPYRDFFEHHAPGLYWCAQPAFWICGPTLSVLWLLRSGMLLCSLATLGLTWRVARKLGLEQAAWLPPLWLAWSSVFVLKGIEFRPDVPATLLLVTVLAWLLPREPGAEVESAKRSRLTVGSPRRTVQWLVVSIAAGGATLMTQKAIVPLAALCVVTAFLDWRRSGLSTVPRAGLAITAGVAGVWGLAWLGFAAVGAGGVFLDSTVAQLVRWSVRSATWDHLRPTLAADTWMWVFTGAAWGLWLFSRPPALAGTENLTAESRQIVLGSTLLCVASLGIVKATFPQYYLLWFPLLALSATLGLGAWRDLPRGPLQKTIGGLLLIPLGLQWLLMARGWRAGASGPLSHLTALPEPLAIGGVLVLWSVVSVGCVAGLSSWVGRRSTVIGLLGMGYLFARIGDTLCWSNAPQCTAIEGVNARIGVTETVLDGFTGLGALRPHAYSIWWLNEFSRGLIPPGQLEADLLRLLNEQPPRGILDDDNLRNLPATVRAVIERDYTPVEPAPLRIRDPGASRSASVAP